MLTASPTGVGKTGIARRLAKIVNAPFVKVEAIEFTGVGYVGRDVESIIRDLMTEIIHMEEKEQFKHAKAGATKEANKTLVRLLVSGTKHENRENQMQRMMQMLMDPQQTEQPREEVIDDIRS